MDKQTADRLITGYLTKLYGFALSKTQNIAEAEELAAAITLEAYDALLHRENICNPDGYIYQVARHVYARYIAGKSKNACCGFDGQFADPTDFTRDLEQLQTQRLLRREIAYLSNIQRQIVIAYYYDRLKVKQIAAQTGLPEGTVKWHLHDAKNSLRKGLDQMRTMGNLGIQPITLCSMGHSGNPGDKGDTSDFLARRLTQNIAYAAYHAPKTIKEIAQELGVSPLFVEDEVQVLEEYGFMDKQPGGKYLTNIYITEPTKELDEQMHHLLCHYADILCERYVPRVIETLDRLDPAGFYIPGNDRNLLLWSVIPYSISYRLHVDKGVSAAAFSVKRPDGGDSIAFACLQSGYRTDFDQDKYNICGDMTRAGKYPWHSWQINTYYDNRPGNWRENLYSDYDALYEFYTGRLPEADANLDKYRRLYEKGYLTETKQVNLIVIQDDNTGWAGNNAFTKKLPGADDELQQLSDQLDQKVYTLQKDHYPAHMQPLTRIQCSNMLTSNGIRARVLEQLVQTGVLQLPSQTQQPGLTTLLFSDVLPK